MNNEEISIEDLKLKSIAEVEDVEDHMVECGYTRHDIKLVIAAIERCGVHYFKSYNVDEIIDSLEHIGDYRSYRDYFFEENISDFLSEYVDWERAFHDHTDDYLVVKDRTIIEVYNIK